MAAIGVPGGLPRVVRAEWLDTLPADDPRARRSRADLRRINRITGALTALRRALDGLIGRGETARLVELGGGDGSLMRRLAQRRGPRWPGSHLVLVDLQPSVAPATRAAIEARGWSVEVVRADALAWLADAPAHAGEIIVANLFVHHFDGAALRTLLGAIAARAGAFVCCEPRRSAVALFGSRCLGALGCNDVTRHDAVASVQAGFGAGELGSLWPADRAWAIDERAAGFFLHRFVARRRRDR